jgi:hypothetical protein
MFERQKIRRQLELQMMSPEEVESAYRGGNQYDRNIILSNINSFTADIQDAIARIIAAERGFWSARSLFTQPSTPVGIGASITPGAPVPITQISNVGAKTVVVQVETSSTTPEEMANLVGEQVKEGMLADDDFQKAFSKKISPKL